MEKHSAKCLGKSNVRSRLLIGADVKTLRKARAGYTVLELSPGAPSKAQFEEALRCTLGDTAPVRSIQPQVNGILACRRGVNHHSSHYSPEKTTETKVYRIIGGHMCNSSKCFCSTGNGTTPEESVNQALVVAGFIN